MSCLFPEERGRRGSVIQAQPDLSHIVLCADVVVVVVRSVVDIFVFIGDVVDNVVCFVCFLRERGQGGRVVLVQPDLPQTLVRRS